MADSANDFNRALIEELRADDGKVTGAFEGVPLLLLSTAGARIGRGYAAHAELVPNFGEDQEKTGRVVPIAVLERAG